MGFYNVYGERQRQEVMEDTWGHLAVDPKKECKGTAFFAKSEDGSTLIIKEDFEGACGPWFYEDLQEYLITDEILFDDASAGSIFKFVGSYKKTWKKRFKGKYTKVELK